MAFDAAKRPLMAMILGATILSAGSIGAPARAEDGGVFDFALGMLGLGSDEKPEITYRERAPLVVPPKMDLPAPQASAVANNPAWPQDPDVLRRKQLEEDKKKPRYRGRSDELAAGRLTPEERAAGYRPGGGVGGPSRPQGNADHYWNDPQMILELERQNKDADFGDGQQQVAVGQEPERRYLTDPPTGYRRQSTAVKLPEEKVVPKSLPNGRPNLDR